MRAERVPGRRFPRPTGGVVPDLEAVKGIERVLVYIIDSPEALDDMKRRTALEALEKARRGRPVARRRGGGVRMASTNGWRDGTFIRTSCT